MAGIGCAHHVLSVEHLLGQLRNCQGPVLLRSTGGQRGKACHEEVQARERHQVDGNLAQITVQLSWEAQAAGHTAHGCRDQVVQVAVCWCRQLQRSEADVVERFVVQQERLIGVLYELVKAQDGIVRLHHRVGDLGRRDHREGLHDAVRVLLSHLGDEQSSHASAGAATERVAELEALEAVAAFSLLAHDVEHRVDEFRTLSVVTLGPVVASSCLSEDEVVGTEELTKRPGSDGVHGSWLKIHQDRSRNVASSCRLVEVHIDSFQLQVRVSMIGACGIDAVLISDHLPELGSDLIAALTTLDVHELAHGCKKHKAIDDTEGA
mmetsp:Transcript_43582/g.103917  ORF Transcript_43582/g.103917 Transcript_43582/m.103917 type:complete len:322 (-) Transcript_43582:34-999(-)